MPPKNANADDAAKKNDETGADEAAKLKAATEVNPDHGPTLVQWLEAGYAAKNYPPAPYHSKSTPEAIETAVKMEESGAKLEDVVAEVVKLEPAQENEAPKEPAPQPKGAAKEGPLLGTAAAADAHLARFPDSPTQPGAKVLNGPLTTGANG